MTKNKEAALLEIDCDVHYYGTTARNRVGEVIDEYAKNQAIAFVEWCNTYGYKKYKELDRWKFDSQMNLTNEDVWSLFLTHQSQQK